MQIEVQLLSRIYFPTFSENPRLNIGIPKKPVHRLAMSGHFYDLNVFELPNVECVRRWAIPFVG